MLGDLVATIFVVSIFLVYAAICVGLAVWAILSWVRRPKTPQGRPWPAKSPDTASARLDSPH